MRYAGWGEAGPEAGARQGRGGSCHCDLRGVIVEGNLETLETELLV